VTPANPPPAWVVDALGPGASHLERVPWGFTNETWVGTAADGRRYAATRMASSAAAATILRRGPAITPRLATVGLETPIPMAGRSLPALGVVVTRWLEGLPGMTRMGDAVGAAQVGGAAGAAWSALRRVDVGGLELDDLWARGGDLQAAATGWLATVRPALASDRATEIRARIERVGEMLRDRRSGFVHGDLVPANVLLREGGPPAVLDLESVRIGDRLFDAAWFGWIVRYHHPELHAPAWAAFLGAAGLGRLSPADSVLLATLPMIRMLEILADQRLPPDSRRRWLDQLAASVA
jgi:aminoglycoside phosphotransferase (APT) family kinase protein